MNENLILERSTCQRNFIRLFKSDVVQYFKTPHPTAVDQPNKMIITDWDDVAAKSFKDFMIVNRRVARNSQWGGLLGGSGGLEAKPTAAGGMGVWGRSPQRSKILHFFAKITSF